MARAFTLTTPMPAAAAVAVKVLRYSKKLKNTTCWQWKYCQFFFAQ
jgi:hypothetical protein